MEAQENCSIVLEISEDKAPSKLLSQLLNILGIEFGKENVTFKIGDVAGWKVQYGRGDLPSKPSVEICGTCIAKTWKNRTKKKLTQKEISRVCTSTEEVCKHILQSEKRSHSDKKFRRKSMDGSEEKAK